jgi:LemA protein
MSTPAIVLLAAAALVLIIVVTMVNTLIGRKNQVANAFASIDTMLKKRYDLIPNLVATVEKYMTYERGVLDQLTACRARAISGSAGEEERVELHNQVGRALRTVFAVAENYPALRASESFLHLQASLNEVEEQLSASRRAYNASVTDYNNGVEMFPLSLVARAMGYRTKPWFEIPEEERQPVRVWR